jgi:hypothetical protein
VKGLTTLDGRIVWRQIEFSKASGIGVAAGELADMKWIGHSTVCSANFCRPYRANHFGSILELVRMRVCLSEMRLQITL